MVEKNLNEILQERFDTDIKKATNEQIYSALLQLTKS